MLQPNQSTANTSERGGMQRGQINRLELGEGRSDFGHTHTVDSPRTILSLSPARRHLTAADHRGSSGTLPWRRYSVRTVGVRGAETNRNSSGYRLPQVPESSTVEPRLAFAGWRMGCQLRTSATMARCAPPALAAYVLQARTPLLLRLGFALCLVSASVSPYQGGKRPVLITHREMNLWGPFG
ncbi:hypothetical protein ASPZODRAFT_129798 [Penicilliopsis zonata CBS 506.65]|uniref:Uncharacterized protein n=1 Tax=Penicilliopsis zonata CBS 506.65 TaxID=1073090 RepID=A0A1L9SQJ7_9EURO|nr:hypothetical protein ASPZODRAFT_129798 [Penicilliopsis zonata CBS 506.65]OJJ49354.1 hypothetical protein ASPZODRAFT_129798 [Penicilliopsis zonata CBS 506.65]